MKNFKNLAILVGLVMLISCEQEQSLTALEGEYEGVFLRSTPNARYQPADVTITFEGNRFSGSSSIRNYPAICQGNFRLVQNEITFENTCFFTADFDWSLILSGTWKVSVKNEEITFTKKTGDITDYYWLKRKKEDV